MFCQNCGAEISDKAVVCVKCGVAVPRYVPTASSDDDPAIRMLVPVGRTGTSIAAGYLGLFSLIPFVGVLALILGIIAIVDINKHPEKHGLGRAWFGAIMGGLSTLFYLFVFCSAGLK